MPASRTTKKKEKNHLFPNSLDICKSIWIIVWMISIPVRYVYTYTCINRHAFKEFCYNIKLFQVLPRVMLKNKSPNFLFSKISPPLPPHCRAQLAWNCNIVQAQIWELGFQVCARHKYHLMTKPLRHRLASSVARRRQKTGNYLTFRKICHRSPSGSNLVRRLLRLTN